MKEHIKIHPLYGTSSTAINGDCMDYMKTLPDKAFELAIVDPPYGGGGGTQWETFKAYPLREPASVQGGAARNAQLQDRGTI